MAFFLAVLALTCSLFLVREYDRSLFATDSLQYLSIAKNFVRGNGLTTSIIYYDEHYRLGRIPAAQTNFPPGYPVLIAILVWFGLSPYSASFLISLAAYNLTGLFIYRFLNAANLERSITVSMTGCWFLLPSVWANILSSLSETAYIFLTLLVVYFLVRAEKQPKSALSYSLLAGLVASLAFSVRYIGIALILSLFIYLLIESAVERPNNRIYRLTSAMMPPVLITAIVFVRNIYLVGSLSGGPSLPANKPFSDLARQLYWALTDLFGVLLPTSSRPTLPAVFFSSSVVTIAIILLTHRKHLHINHPWISNFRWHSPFTFALIYVFTTLGVLTYQARTIIYIDLYPRYLIPLIPFGLIILAHGLHLLLSVCPHKRNCTALTGLFLFLTFVTGQIAVFHSEWQALTNRQNTHRKVQQALQRSVGKTTVGELLGTRVTEASPLFADKAPLVGTILDRPTLGPTRALFTRRIWTLDEVHELVRKYHVSFVLLFPDLFDPSED